MELLFQFFAGLPAPKAIARFVGATSQPEKRLSLMAFRTKRGGFNRAQRTEAMMPKSDFADHADLGQALAEAIEELESKRLFAGDMEFVFIVPLEDGTEYEVVIKRRA